LPLQKETILTEFNDEDDDGEEEEEEVVE